MDRGFHSNTGASSRAKTSVLWRWLTMARAAAAARPGWRQLPWPVDDNYLGRLKAFAGRVREAGLLW